MVVVPKKDGTIRISMNYQRLNSVSTVDAYPMPRVNGLSYLNYMYVLSYLNYVQNQEAKD